MKTVHAYDGAYNALLGRKACKFRGRGLNRHVAFLNRLDRRIKKALKTKGDELKPIAF